MGKLIGYKGTERDRANNWYTMLCYRGHKEVFSDPNKIPDEVRRKKILDRALENYKKELKEYIT